MKHTIITNISVDEYDRSFKTLIKTITVSLNQVTIFLVSDSLQYKYNNITHRIGQKLPPPVK